MKYITAFLWTIIYGQLIGYMGSTLTHTQYNAVNTLIVSMIVGVLFFLLSAVLNSENKKE